MAVLSNTGIRMGASGASDTYRVKRSTRFNSADTAHLTKTPSSAGNRKRWTWSGWIKRSDFASNQNIFGAGVNVFDGSAGGAHTTLCFYSDKSIELYDYEGSYGYQIKTSAVYRDCSAWMHIVAVLDTPNSTTNDRVRLYVNGERITALATNTMPSLDAEETINNTAAHYLGLNTGDTLNAYMAEVHFIDGQALDASYFGETNATTGEWVAKEYEGTYGSAYWNGELWTSELTADNSGSLTGIGGFDGDEDTYVDSSNGATLDLTGTTFGTGSHFIRLKTGGASSVTFNGSGLTDPGGGGAKIWTGTITGELTTGSVVGNASIYFIEIDGKKLVEPSNTDQTWSSSLTSNGTLQNAINAFSRSTALRAQTANYAAGKTITFGPSSAVSFSSKLEVMCDQGSATPTATWNSNVANPGQNTWVTVYSGSGSISASTPLVINTESAGEYATLKGIRLDGKQLIDPGSEVDNSFYFKFDGTDLGEDSSGNDNDWTANNLTADTSFGSLTGSDGNAPEKYATGAFSGATANASNFHRPNGNGNNEYLTWTPSAPHTAGSTLKVYLDVAAKTGTRGLYVNGSDVTSHVTVTENTPVTNVDEWSVNLSAASITSVTSVATPQMSSGTTYLHGISIDGTYVADYGLDVDVTTDSPTSFDDDDKGTGNYATWNPLRSLSTFKQGNLSITSHSSGTYHTTPTTLAMTSGKWYCEMKPSATGGTNNAYGIMNDTTNTDTYLGATTGTDSSMGLWDNGGTYRNGAYTNASYCSAFQTGGEVIGLAFDVDNGTLKFYINGVDKGNAWTDIPAGTWHFCVTTYQTTTTHISLNCGQQGFAYTPPSGYKALNTYNLPDPTIKDPSKHFDTKLWTGNGSTQTISGLNFSPDILWYKSRTAAANHGLQDTVRGVGKAISPNQDAAEATETTGLDTFTSDGFTLDGVGNWNINVDTETMVGWAWDAGSSNTTNDASSTGIGTIDSTYRVNTDAGFSIVSYIGNGTAGASIAHGLNATPDFAIFKDGKWQHWWTVYHKSMGNTHLMYLNTNGAKLTESGAMWNDTSPTSSVMTFGNGSGTNVNTGEYMGYIWSEVEGYSKFGSYTGNGSADGPFVYCGFKPAFVMIKSTGSGEGWVMFDNKRDPDNVVLQLLYANTTAVEVSASGYQDTDFVSNGFKIRQTNGAVNTSTQEYIFAAFAESPLKYATGK